jgi:hypothetical protein
MARRYATALDLQRNELQNARIQNLGAAPGTPVEGQVYWDSGAGVKKLMVHNGTAFVPLLTGPILSADITDGTIVNADINAAAAIARAKLDFGAGLVNVDIAAAAAVAYSKLNLANSIVNADIAAAAAIAWSKINSTGLILNADIGAAAAIAYSKLALANSIVNADISATAAIAYSKLSLAGSITNADLAGSIALSKLAVDPLARANHTGTQLAATISNFDTQVRTSRLDQMAVPTAAVALGAQKITGLADGTASTDAVTKQQLDAVASGLDVKASVHLASTTNITVASPGATIDSVAATAGDRVLLKNQTTASENGIYIWNGAAVPMTRATDADTSAEVTPGMFTFVEEGTVHADSGWVLTTNAPIVLGTTGLAFTQFSGAGSYTGGNGLTLTGSDFAVNVDGSSIEINADILRVKALGITGAMIAAGTIDLLTKVTGALPIANGGTGAATAPLARTALGAPGVYSNNATHGAGTTIAITAATHALGTGRNKVVQIREEATGDEIEADTNVAANGDVTITFAVSQTANTMRVLIVGW